jgi:hypothetical protein
VVVIFPSLEDDENSENVFPNIPPFPEASPVVPVVVVVVASFPEASLENSENGSSFCENKSLILVVPPNNDEII